MIHIITNISILYNDFVQNYNNTLSEVMNRYAQLKTKNMVVRPTVPWYNDNINAAKRLRRKAERSAEERNRILTTLTLRGRKTMLLIL